MISSISPLIKQFLLGSLLKSSTNILFSSFKPFSLMDEIICFIGSISEIVVLGVICSSVSTFDNDNMSSINLFIRFASSSIIFRNLLRSFSSLTEPDNKVSIKPTKLVKGDLSS